MLAINWINAPVVLNWNCWESVENMKKAALIASAFSSTGIPNTALIFGRFRVTFWLRPSEIASRVNICLEYWNYKTIMLVIVDTNHSKSHHGCCMMIAPCKYRLSLKSLQGESTSLTESWEGKEQTKKDTWIEWRECGQHLSCLEAPKLGPTAYRCTTSLIWLVGFAPNMGGFSCFHVFDPFTISSTWGHPSWSKCTNCSDQMTSSMSPNIPWA